MHHVENIDATYVISFLNIIMEGENEDVIILQWYYVPIYYIYCTTGLQLATHDNNDYRLKTENLGYLDAVLRYM